MARQTRKKLAQLTEQFPFLASIRADWGRDTVPIETSIHVQKPDTETMHLQPRDIHFTGRSYVPHPKRGGAMPGTRLEYLHAVAQNHKSIAFLGFDLRGSTGWSLKEIFPLANQSHPREEVRYLVWTSVVRWYNRAPEDSDRIFTGKLMGIQLTIIIYPQRKDISWEELVERADREKKEREEAYLHNPKVMPDFPGIHQALSEGHKLHAFRSGGGLRVVSLSKGKNDRAYGEHPHVEDALNHLEEDFQAGGRPYNEVYGKKYPHYLTGSSDATSNLDSWLLQGHTFDSWQEGEDVVFQLKGYAHYKAPDWAQRWAEANPETPVYWADRGFVFELMFTHPGWTSDELGQVMRVFGGVEGKREHNAFFYQVTKTGRGKTFWEAFQASLGAPEMEVLSPLEAALLPLSGTFRGFSPTDESAVVMGELEATVGYGITLRMATGLKVMEEYIPLTELRLLSAEETRALLEDQSPENVSRHIAFRVGEGVGLVFNTNPADDEPGLTAFGTIADILGPTVLFSPEQVAKGLFDKAVAMIEQDFGEQGVIPRLSNKGLAPSRS